MDSKKSIAELASMPHLSDEEMAEQVSQHLEPAPKAAPEDPTWREDHPFEFEWKDESGRSWRGSFVNRILTIREKRQVAVLEATFAGGLPFQSISPYQRGLNHACAHMAISLTERPKWAEDLSAIHEDRVIMALWEVVQSHEEGFRGLDRASEDRAEQSG